MKVGVIREGKIPSDSRVPLTPQQVGSLTKNGADICVQHSPVRSYKDEEYAAEGCLMTDNVDACDVLLGVKEVPIAQLKANKTHFFFSHTIKAQPYNRDLLRAVLDKNITLIDWECLTNEKGQRVIAFGRWAGIVGAHNGMMAYGERTKTYSLPAMNGLKDFAEAKSIYATTSLPSMKIVVTGKGRVSKGSAEVLDHLGIKRVEPSAFLTQSFNEPVYTMLGIVDMYQKGDEPMNKADYYENFKEYDSRFEAYTKVADVMINGIYWEPGVPVFFSAEDMRSSDFNIKTIADITCDIAPEASIPSTLKAAVIGDPTFGYDVNTGKECAPYTDGSVDMMTVDNLPNELPRDASEAFGEQFLDFVWPELQKDRSDMLDRATIAKGGSLTAEYSYLQDYVDGKD